MQAAITTTNLGKRYKRYHSDKPWTLIEAVARGIHRIRPDETYWGLRNINLSVNPGQMLGIIGHNGAGKSTLLRLMGGILRPDEGTMQVRGRIGGFLDLQAGLRPDLTGRENIFVSGVIAGLTRREVVKRFDSMVEFAELADFIDSPLRTYSSGMQIRLAFAVAAHTRPDVLLIDEVLAVGDMAFQQKCINRIRQFQSAGTAIVLVSHSVHVVEEFCDEAIWLRAGQIAAQGKPNAIVPDYVSEMTNAPSSE